MLRFIPFIIVGVITSFYFFPISFTFLPTSINTKMMLAVMGIFFVIYDCIKKEKVTMPQGLLVPTCIAAVFSIICLISTDINHTTDYAYASYITSFFVWLGGAYTVSLAIKTVHGYADFRLLTYYLAGVCFSQCALALMIDNIPAFQNLVDSIVTQGQDFLQEVDRLYGIGAALDPAGVRFSLVLVMIAGVLGNDIDTRKDSLTITLLLVAFFTIAVIGNMISRTTILGLGSAIVYFMISSGLFRVSVQHNAIKLGLLFGVLLLAAIVVSVYLYNTSHVFYDYSRFAFEGFFNWVEKGEWRTDSTDKLNKVMWIWPDNDKTWIIGSGLFDNFIYATDVGYCRFILYCGLIGFVVFSFLFVYLGFYFSYKEPKYRIMFFIFIGLTFAIWLKVATDIFQIYALFFCLDQFITPSEEELSDENSI